MNNTNKNIEVELKFQVMDSFRSEKFTEKLRFVEEKRIVDIYLDTGKGDLYKKGVFLRVRDDKRLDFKFNLADFQNQNELSRHEHCNEFSFSIPLPKDSVSSINEICQILNLGKIKNPNLKELKVKNNLINSMIIDKIRQIYNDGTFEYSLDNVKGLGKFIEIEFLASPEDNLDKIKKEMRTKFKNLNLKLITTGYNEVYWRKNNFDLYLQGRYLFEEDYKKYRPLFQKG